MAKYSKELKSRIVQKLTEPNAPSALYLSKEINISSATLSRWVRQFKESGVVYMSKKNRRPKDISVEERFSILLQANKLEDEEFGVFLRKEGLKSSDIKQWQEEFMTATHKNKDIIEIRNLKKKNKDLEKEIRRKDKALAETSALLILKKKANLIWGEDEE